ncbi:hypothetical protein MTR_4g116220 [Medicago truncatula]|uniref:Uncharacterized protein n=1 Tax=Medicago truncatula TaxID=3880 RepID=G7JGM3_MEDTR|nr:hypothetical protein MTR_4g116220 [Medicago truncatula]
MGANSIWKCLHIPTLRLLIFLQRSVLGVANDIGENVGLFPGIVGVTVFCYADFHIIKL